LRVVLTDKFTDGWIDRITVANFPLQTGSCPGWYGYGCTRGDLSHPQIQNDKPRSNWEREEARARIFCSSPTTS